MDLRVNRTMSPLWSPVTKLKGLSAGVAHALALTTDNRVVPWGPDFGSGELEVPRRNMTDPFVAVAAGRNHSLMLRESGRVMSYGILEDEDVPDAARSNVTHIAAGWGFHA